MQAPPMGGVVRAYVTASQPEYQPASPLPSASASASASASGLSSP